MHINSSNNVEDFMCASDLLILPSLFEVSPLVVHEARATGLPILVSETVKDLNSDEDIFRFSLEYDESMWLREIVRILEEADEKPPREFNYSKSNRISIESFFELGDIYEKIIT